MTDPLGQSQVLPYITGLSKKGYEFHLISFEKMDRFIEHKRHIRNYCAANKINWHPQDYQINGGLRNTIRQVRKMRKVALFLHSQHDFKIVHCRSYISALVGLRLKRIYGMKFIFDMRGFWADERVDGKIWSLSSPIYKTIYKYFKRKEIKFFAHSDHNISLTEKGKSEILTWDIFKKNPPPITVIPCCVNLDLFDPSKINNEEKDMLRKSLEIPESAFVLGYVGSIGTWYMLSEMLDYFKCLRASNPAAVFLFVSGENPEMIKSRAVEHGIDPSAILVTSTLHDQVPIHISLFDHSIFFIRASYSKMASSPTKQGEIMAMGIPLICNSGIGDTDEIVHKYNSGIVINEFSEAVYKAEIENATELDPKAISAGAKDYFSLEEGVERYHSIYKKIYG